MFTDPRIISGDIKSYVQIINIGKKSVAEVFSKTVTCFSSHLLAVWVPPTTCTTPGVHHQYGQSCDNTGPDRAQPGYWSEQYVFSMFSCDDGWGGDNISTVPIDHGGGGSADPYFVQYGPECMILKNKLEKAKAMMNTPDVKNKNIAMASDILTAPNEKHFYISKTGTNNYSAGPVQTLGANGGNASVPPNFNPIADVHTHNGNTTVPGVASPPDMYGLQQLHAQYADFDIRFTDGSDGSMYALVLTDAIALGEFVQQHPLAATVNLYNAQSNPSGDNFWIKDSKIYNDFMKAARHFVGQGYSQNDAFTYGMAFVTKKHNMGLVLSKREANGDFRPIEIKTKRRQLDPENLDYEVTNPCNL